MTLEINMDFKKGVWYKKDEVLPDLTLEFFKFNRRVLVFSPVYSGNDSTMEFRMMNAGFVKLASDAEWWTVPKHPPMSLN
jgi:hypothetical protein